MGLIIKSDVQGREAAIELTDAEVKQANGMLKRSNVKTLVVMKKHNGGALFFINPVNAANAQERHGYDYAFSVDAEMLGKATTEKKG